MAHFTGELLTLGRLGTPAGDGLTVAINNVFKRAGASCGARKDEVDRLVTILNAPGTSSMEDIIEYVGMCVADKKKCDDDLLLLTKQKKDCADRLFLVEQQIQDRTLPQIVALDKALQNCQAQSPPDGSSTVPSEQAPTKFNPLLLLALAAVAVAATRR